MTCQLGDIDVVLMCVAAVVNIAFVELLFLSLAICEVWLLAVLRQVDCSATACARSAQDHNHTFGFALAPQFVFPNVVSSCT